MSFVFASICPHPPILVPKIGGKETAKVKKTTEAMNELSKIISQKEPETLVFISPHGLVYPDRMNVCGMENLYGDLSYFGAPEINFKLKNDLELASEIDKKANQAGIKTLLYNNSQDFFILDHGILVPLYFLAQRLDKPFKIVPITYSYQRRIEHYKFGQIIQEILKNYHKTVGIIASGDLSHRLIPTDPNGYHPEGKKFDTQLQEALIKKDIRTILEFDEDVLEEAGECGYRSILILLGALSGLKWKAEILSYEGPFGVGYLVCNIKLTT